MEPLPNSLLFDLDGTILDSLPGIESSVRTAFARCGLAVPEFSLRDLIGPPIRVILSRAGEITDETLLDKLESAFRADYDSEGWQKTICFPDAVRVLRALRLSGRKLFVISNKPLSISLRILEREKILSLFETVVTRDARQLPDAGKQEMIRMLLQERGLAPEDCVFVGDTMEDAKAAAANGITFIHMAHGYGQVEPLHGAVMHCAASFSQFCPLSLEESVRG